MKNKMEQVAQILGLNLGERFYIKYPDVENLWDCVYLMTENGIVGLTEDEFQDDWDRYLIRLILGDYVLQKNRLKDDFQAP